MKCKNCNGIGFSEKEMFHDFECPYNKLDIEEWNKENKLREARIAEMLEKELDFRNKAEKMSYRELAVYLIDHFWAKQRLGTMESAAIDRAISIIEELAEINNNINNDLSKN